jgi:hypothetical protein
MEMQKRQLSFSVVTSLRDINHVTKGLIERFDKLKIPYDTLNTD